MNNFENIHSDDAADVDDDVMRRRRMIGRIMRMMVAMAMMIV